jgi:plasmid stabilization system protein ParE
MSGTLPVRIVGSAARAIAEAGKWWAANRPKAPDAFAVDLERALQLIASQPAIGARARNAKLVDVRRVHLARVRYYLYYRLTSEPAIEVLALWHTSRSTTPQL